MPFEVGQRIGDYEVQERLGVGEIGRAYRVRHVISNRTQAMKVLLPDLAAQPELATRLITEIRTLASFDHPNIAQPHTMLVAENQMIMMMEYVEGDTLEQIVKQRAMPAGEAAWYVSQPLAALSYAHGRGVVHGDVKPANLMVTGKIVTSNGIVKLMDFDTARPGTATGSVYMSPEQMRGDPIDARSDIYSVGVVLYELLTGQRPVESATNEPLRLPIELDPAIPAGLSAITMIAMAKDPSQRFQNADAFRNALKSFCLTPATPEKVVVPIPVAAPAAAVADIPLPDSGPSLSEPAVSFTPPPAVTITPPATAPLAAASPAPFAEIPSAQPASNLPSALPPRNHKSLWIATGAIAAILALVALGIAGPQWMKTHAAGSAGATATTPAASTPAATTPDAAAPSTDLPPAPAPNSNTGSSASDTAAASSGVSSQQPSTSSSLPAPDGSGRTKEHKQADVHTQNEARMAARQAANQAAAQPLPQQQQVQPQPPQKMQGQQHEGAEGLAQVQDRLVDMDARASAARRQVGQIRKQQEEAGLGMRNDVELAESRLDSDLRAAKQDVARGDATSASQDLNKAEPELKTLERFLGH